MKPEILKWLAEQLGLRFQPEHAELCLGQRRGGGSCRCGYSPIDLESDTPEAAYLREKVVKWLGERCGVYLVCDTNILPIQEGWAAANGDGDIIENATYEQAIIAAVEWVYNQGVK